MDFRKKCSLCLFVFGCLLINTLGKLLANALQLPIWLDAVGTVFSAYALGPVCGAIIGAASNIIYGIHSAASLFYVLTNIAVGIIVGLSAKNGYLKDLFGILSTAFVVTVISVTLSVPINYILSGGAVGNIWGDGIVGLLQKTGINSIISHIAGQFYVDFLDKTLTMLLLFITVKLINRKKAKDTGSPHKNHSGIISCFIAALLLFSSFTPTNTVYAEENGDNFRKYIKTVYNGENGLPGGMANDIVQTKDGVLWIGTYGGLYRFCGNDIEWMNHLESVKTVNCLYTDEAGRLWIGTNDNGLSIFINDRICNVLNKKDGFPSNSVRCITEGTDGYYYAGTTDSLVVLTLSGGLKVYDTIPEIMFAKRICSDNSGNIAAVTDEGVLYLVRGTEIISRRTLDKEGEFYSCCAFDGNGILYAGSSVNTVEAYDISDGHFDKRSSTAFSSLSGINSLNFSDDGTLFVCADNGAEYLSPNGEPFIIDTNNFNSSIEHMLIDYQGNLWFTSSRLGLLCMNPSIFTEIGEYDGLSGNVVNTIIKWQGTMYVGTDSGLETLSDGKSVLESRLVSELSGIRIRCLMEDSSNDLWICTSGKGIWKVSPDGKITVLDSSCGIVGDKLRSVIEARDGTVIAAGDNGISFINDDRVSGTISAADGLTNPKILSLCETDDGSILAGTDGNGIAVIRDGRIADTIKQENGLSSDIILRIVPDKDNSGIFIVTTNGLCYMDDNNEIRVLKNFPYYNNYDILEGNNGELFVLCSAGIYIVDKQELLSGDNVKYLLLDAKRGLRSALTPNAWNYLDEDNSLYLSCDSGAVCFNIEHYDVSMRSYRMLLKEIRADGMDCLIEKGAQITIPVGTAEVEITPEIVNFSVNDPDISIFMEGFDTEPRVIPQSELSTIVYSNMPSGKYVFHLAILDSITGSVIAENTYRIVKEPEIYEHSWFKLYAAIVGIFSIAYLTWLFVRTQIQKTFRMQKMELELAKKHIRMGNETILTIAKAVDAKDVNTSQHSVRVSEYSVMIARKLGYSDEECENLRKIAILHDIGKIGIPDSVLNKPERLTDEEYAIMKSHVVRGAEILKNFSMIDNVADGALYHHERYDGHGYVNGLKGEEIPLNARIIGIADAFDAMTANRVYRKKLDLSFVLEELRKGRGTQFDPKLVDIMLELIDDGTIDVEQIYGKKLSEVCANEV